jgi:hypothetical protein
MRILLLSILFVGFCLSCNAQYCTSGGPSSTADSNIESVTITGTSGSINYTGCPGIIGLEQYTAQTVSLGQGNNFSLDVQFGTCGGNYTGAGEVWIDFNQNYTFDPSESIGTWTGIPPGPISTFNFTVPGTAALGATKMRIIQQEAGINPLNPCGSFTWGSATDFNVNIIQGVDCSAFSGDDMADAIDVATLPYTDNSSNSVCYTNQNPTYSSPDVYYRVVTDPANPYIKASLCGSNFDTFISVVEPNGTFIAGNDDATTCGPQSEVIFDATNHPIVYVIVEGWGAEYGDYTLTLNDDLLNIGESEIDDLKIYPNPTNGLITLSNELPGSLEISTMNGKIVLSANVDAFANVSLENVAAGVYFLKYTSGNQFVIKKLIKE